MSDLSTANAADSHEAIEMLLPWYANGRLSADETAEVERHLAHCPMCRTELAQCRSLAQAMQNDEGEGWQPSPGGFDRLLAQIDQLESPSASAPMRPPDVADSPSTILRSTSPTSGQAYRPTLWERLCDWLQSTPNPIRWTLALESCVVAALLLIVLLPGRLPTAPDYETLSNANPPASPIAGLRVRVIFNNTATVGDMQQLLHEIKGEIVAGPTALGVYTVALSDGAAARQKLTEVVKHLRLYPHIRLAEPMDGETP